LTLLRSALFNLLFYGSFALLCVLGLVFYFGPRRWALRACQAWGRFAFWLMRVVLGLKTEFRGLERIPPGALLVASKHQSLFETLALLSVFHDPTFILKRELMLIPVFGWWMSKLQMIPVNRGARSAALASVARRAHSEAARGRQVLIFPEGTRRSPGEPPAYKFGATFLYSDLGIPCLPVALNSGLFWQRRSFLRYPGTIVIEFLEPIPPGLSREEFSSRLQERIETASDRLLAEALAGPHPPPFRGAPASRSAPLSPTSAG